VADQAYRLSLAPGARRTLTEAPPVGLPIAVAGVVATFITGPLLDTPRLVGKRLTRELAGYYSARRGAYRATYSVGDTAHTVHVVRIDHRADLYRPERAA